MDNYELKESPADFIPDIEYTDPIFKGLTVHFQVLSDSVWIWRFQKEPSINERKSEKSSGLSKKERYHTIRKTILAHVLQHHESDIHIEPDYLGRPVLMQPKSALSFSTSYTRSCWVLAVIQSGPIGIDVEDINSDPDIPKIARRFFHYNEYEYISKAPENYQIPTFFQFWVLKEAYLKAIGTGFAGLQGLPDFSVHINNFQKMQNTPFSVGNGYQVHLQHTDTVYLAVVFPENKFS